VEWLKPKLGQQMWVCCMTMFALALVEQAQRSFVEPASVSTVHVLSCHSRLIHALVISWCCLRGQGMFAAATAAFLCAHGSPWLCLVGLTSGCCDLTHIRMRSLHTCRPALCVGILSHHVLPYTRLLDCCVFAAAPLANRYAFAGQRCLAALAAAL
jgi:hypothetical protein